MICYKWVIKEKDLYYPLINYGINSWMTEIKCIPYLLNEIYDNPIYDLNNWRDRLKTRIKNSFEIPGFHFWKNTINSYYKQYNTYLLKYSKINKITILKCKIFSIIKENNERLISNKFRVLEEVYE